MNETPFWIGLFCGWCIGTVSAMIIALYWIHCDKSMNEEILSRRAQLYFSLSDRIPCWLANIVAFRCPKRWLPEFEEEVLKVIFKYPSEDVA